jgi:hypothetical protein
MVVAGSSAVGGPSPVLSVENVATSVWDTDPSKVGVELQIVNSGGTPAADVRVTSVAVRGGALSGLSALPIALGNIGPRGTALLDFVIAVPRTDGTGYLLTISGTYRDAAAPRPFSLTRTVAPSAAGPSSIIGKSGVSPKGSSPPADPGQPPKASGPPVGPNATTPMLIPVGPPRQLSLPDPGEVGPVIKER